MLPPSDSFRHQLQKLAEVRANRNNPPPTPPPAYTLSACLPDGRTVMAIDPNQEEESGPIIIRIDNSISVNGEDNTVIVPSGATRAATQTEADSCSANRPTPRHTNMSSTVTAIIDALNRVNALCDMSGNLRTLEVDLNAGIKIDGRNNTICMGNVAKVPQPKTQAPAVRQNLGHKRRATSEPAGCPPSTRLRT
ncbi:uncharacterized protein N7511_006576 [Penicillium nucicola]|uniref:uncharacterized protein n=1 Tax=Penicillium nucicola TaxID=1850975 RepID=UPI0025456F9F|nr:uncharacterized protein N7511_006576 [Penicillium nucicola]KAJ5757882.1 hypothetical protein N7511_006576 [Penicillium nucicola]